MRGFTLLALMAIITAPVFGYGGYSAEALNDDLYVDLFCETYILEDEAEIARVLEGYNITIDEFEAYTEELIDNPIRTEAVSMALIERDAFAGMSFSLVTAFSDWDWEDFEPWRYFSPELTVNT